MSDKVEYAVSDRGFKHYPPVGSTYGGSIRVSESSSAIAPHVWLFGQTPADLNDPSSEPIDSSFHLTLENAALLRDQLTHLIDNHYQVT